MPDEPAELDTVHLTRCVTDIQAGRPGAGDELFRAVLDRLERLTRKMLKGFPAVRDSAETPDVLQGASMRLLNALRSLRPATTRDFFNLAALQIRRELLDIARKLARRPETRLDDAGPGSEPADPGPPSPEELGRWQQFHEAIDDLPEREREVVGLVFYHGWTQPQIAELFAVTPRQVRRWWSSACLRLQRVLGGNLPLD